MRVAIVCEGSTDFAVLESLALDIIDADEEFNAADYARIARATCDEIASRGRRAILVGGTFFFSPLFIR